MNKVMTEKDANDILEKYGLKHLDKISGKELSIGIRKFFVTNKASMELYVRRKRNDITVGEILQLKYILKKNNPPFKLFEKYGLMKLYDNDFVDIQESLDFLWPMRKRKKAVS